ncbi:hypothetical protein COBT_003802, partial [Conglomerata obtusa]
KPGINKVTSTYDLNNTSSINKNVDGSHLSDGLAEEEQNLTFLGDSNSTAYKNFEEVLRLSKTLSKKIKDKRKMKHNHCIKLDDIETIEFLFDKTSSIGSLFDLNNFKYQDDLDQSQFNLYADIKYKQNKNKLILSIAKFDKNINNLNKTIFNKHLEKHEKIKNLIKINVKHKKN